MEAVMEKRDYATYDNKGTCLGWYIDGKKMNMLDCLMYLRNDIGLSDNEAKSYMKLMKEAGK